jgi:hypothetical protein
VGTLLVEGLGFGTVDETFENNRTVRIPASAPSATTDSSARDRVSRYHRDEKYSLSGAIWTSRPRPTALLLAASFAIKSAYQKE